MKGRRFCCFMVALQLACWVSAATRPFLLPPYPILHRQGPEEPPQSPPHTLQPRKGSMRLEVMTEKIQETYRRGVSKIGSSPPICEHKCNGCTPCEAIQVPSTSRSHSHLGVQYANYEPESWKCKCGPSFYSP